MVNTQALQGNWHAIKGKIREKWGQLTDDDLESFDGSTEHLVGTIQQKTGAARDYIEEVLDQLAAGGNSILGRAGETVQNYASNAAQAVSRVAENVAGGVREGVSGAERVVRDYPAPSVAAAFGAGMMCGLVVGLFLRMGD